jgi:hypothetical protein
MSEEKINSKNTDSSDLTGKEKLVYDCLKSGKKISDTIKECKTSYAVVKAVRDKYKDELPDSRERGSRKVHIGARFRGPLYWKVIAECKRLDISKNDFLEMTAEMYFEKMDEVYGPA